MYFRTNQITVVSILSDNSAMWIGTEAGSIYKISLPDLETIESDNIHQDQILQMYKFLKDLFLLSNYHPCIYTYMKIPRK